MFRKLLLPTDGSYHADRAAAAILDLAKKLPGAEVTILHVSHEAPSRSELLHTNFDVKSLLEAEAHRAITKTEGSFKEAGVPYSLKVALGAAADQIVDIADIDSYDLIVIGSRGLNKVSEMLLGSVSRQVTHDAKCPVMIVK